MRRACAGSPARRVTLRACPILALFMSTAHAALAASTAAAPLQLYLIRHGETEWSLSGRHTGHTEVPLTALGERMAQALAPRLAQVNFAQVWVSPRLRARQTCAGAGLAHRAETVPDLAEWHYGAYEGLRSQEVRQARPGWNVWTDGCPDGEMPEQVSARADRVIARLCTLSGPVALFTHGQFGRVLAARWIGQPAALGQHFTLDPATVCLLGRDPGHPQRHVIQAWNVVAG
jgi:broad specificity phosphatase PhoE